MISITKKRKSFGKQHERLLFFCSIKTFLFPKDPTGTPKKKQRCSYHGQRCFNNEIIISKSSVHTTTYMDGLSTDIA